MPPLSRWMLTLAFLYLFGGVTLGACLLSQQAGMMHIPPRLVLLHPLWLLQGWLFSTILAMAYWIFPRIRGNERPKTAWAFTSCFLLHLGIFLCTWHVLAQTSQTLQSIGQILCFASLPTMLVHLLPRIKSFG